MSHKLAARPPPSKQTSARQCLLLVLAAALAACGSDRAGEGDRGSDVTDDPVVPTLAPLPVKFDGTWQGLLPCVDCDGIGMVLHLQRDGDVAVFEMRERYFGATADDYVSEGAWSEVACTLAGEPGLCVTLEEPALRWYRRGDGSLQGVDSEGHALDGGDALQRR